MRNEKIIAEHNAKGTDRGSGMTHDAAEKKQSEALPIKKGRAVSGPSFSQFKK